MSKKRSKASKKKRNELRRRKGFIKYTQEEKGFMKLLPNPELVEEGLQISDEINDICNEIDEIGWKACFNKYNSEKEKNEALEDIIQKKESLLKKANEFKEKYKDNLEFFYQDNDVFPLRSNKMEDISYLFTEDLNEFHLAEFNAEYQAIKEGRLEPMTAEEWKELEIF